MSYSLKLLKGGYIGDYMGEYLWLMCLLGLALLSADTSVAIATVTLITSIISMTVVGPFQKNPVRPKPAEGSPAQSLLDASQCPVRMDSWNYAQSVQVPYNQVLGLRFWASI